MADPTQNSRNPANSGSLAGTLQEVMGKFLSSVDDMLPAVVIDYDRTENRATVRPLIRILKTDNTLEDRAQIASIPVLNIGGGLAVLTFNILPGDLGWVKASDRDISLFLQNETGEDVPPNTLRKHDFGDAIFIPDQFKNFTIPTGDEDAVVLQTLNGGEKISVAMDGIRIVSDNLLLMNAPSIPITGAIFHLGDLQVFGSIVATGDITGAGVSLLTHTHAGSPTAPTGAVSDTGSPI